MRLKKSQCLLGTAVTHFLVLDVKVITPSIKACMLYKVQIEMMQNYSPKAFGVYRN